MAFTPQPLNFNLCRKLAVIRLEEANILYREGQYSGAYYLSGYVIELGLKAYYCSKGVFPDKKIVESLYKHDPDTLLNACGLISEYYKDIKINTSLLKSWEIVRDWNEKSRYNQINKNDSTVMLKSVEEVFQWIQTKW